ncbi:hypothetical protein B0H13DRAFT_1898976 [Mycena leptocephala]|nr:hypothetical protein B0H13DRAFT_1898976 [Mycena leptocephala]
MFMPEHQRARRQDGIAGRVARVEVEAGRGTVSNANAGWKKRKSSGDDLERRKRGNERRQKRREAVTETAGPFKPKLKTHQAWIVSSCLALHRTTDDTHPATTVLAEVPHSVGVVYTNRGLRPRLPALSERTEKNIHAHGADTPNDSGIQRAEINRKKVESPAKTKSKEMEFPGCDESPLAPAPRSFLVLYPRTRAPAHKYDTRRMTQRSTAQTSSCGYVNTMSRSGPRTRKWRIRWFFFDAAGSGFYARRYDASRATRIVFTSAGDRDSHARRDERPDKNARLWAVQWEGTAVRRHHFGTNLHRGRLVDFLVADNISDW